MRILLFWEVWPLLGSSQMSLLGKQWTGFKWPLSQTSALAFSPLCLYPQPLTLHSNRSVPPPVLFLLSIWKSPFRVRSLFTESWKELWLQEERAHGVYSKDTSKCKHLDSSLGPLPQCHDSMQLWQTLLISYYFLWATCWTIWWSICFFNVGDWGQRRRRQGDNNWRLP